MTFSKPYLSGDKEYLEVYHKKTFEEGDPTGLTEYSEGQYPYSEKEDWPEWEWTWPEMPFPTPVEISLPDDLPVKGDCDVEDECELAAITGPDAMDCGDTAIYLQAHVFIGCGPAPWWAAFGSWELIGGGADCEIISQSPIGCRVGCKSQGTPGQSYPREMELRYLGPLECDATHTILLDCYVCCEDQMALSGNDTVNQSATWTGTIAPACPGVTAKISGSECDYTPRVNQAGSQVTVSVGSSDCGSFTVTVTGPVGDGTCAANVASKTVRVNGASNWVFQGECCEESGTPCYDFPGDTIAEIISGDQKWGNGGTGCGGNWYNYCASAECSCSCPTCLGWPPGYPQGSCPRGPCGAGYTFPCTGNSCSHCHWECTGGC